jgi:hypothetical protein
MAKESDIGAKRTGFRFRCRNAALAVLGTCRAGFG